MVTVEELAEKLNNIESSRLHLKDKVASLETKIDGLQGAVDDINEIKKTLANLENGLLGNEKYGTESLFHEVRKNTEFRQRSQWTMNLLIGINTLFTSGVIGLIVMAIFNYLGNQ